MDKYRASYCVKFLIAVNRCQTTKVNIEKSRIIARFLRGNDGVELPLGKDEVTGSTPVRSSTFPL